MDTLKRLHNCLGETITGFNRLLASIVVLGCLFMTSFFALSTLLQQPETVFKVQAFQYNYLDSLPKENARVPKAADDNWDGTVAGASLGFAAGRMVPVFGPVLGLLAGAAAGYEADSRI